MSHREQKGVYHPAKANQCDPVRASDGRHPVFVQSGCQPHRCAAGLHRLSLYLFCHRARSRSLRRACGCACRVPAAVLDHAVKAARMADRHADHGAQRRRGDDSPVADLCLRRCGDGVRHPRVYAPVRGAYLSRHAV